MCEGVGRERGRKSGKLGSPKRVECAGVGAGADGCSRCSRCSRCRVAGAHTLERLKDVDAFLFRFPLEVERHVPEASSERVLLSLQSRLWCRGFGTPSYKMAGGAGFTVMQRAPGEPPSRARALGRGSPRGASSHAGRRCGGERRWKDAQRRGNGRGSGQPGDAIEAVHRGSG